MAMRTANSGRFDQKSGRGVRDREISERAFFFDVIPDCVG